jgi:hypothetical protein
MDYIDCFNSRWIMENDEEIKKAQRQGQLKAWKEKVGRARISRKKRHN